MFSYCAATAGGSGDGAGEGELPDPHGGGGGREQWRQRHRGLREQTSGKDTPIHTLYASMPHLCTIPTESGLCILWGK